MIPVRLEIKNFLPYRAPDPVQFEGIHLACLTGPNGAGKSSLLDAITWALWGKSRAKRDDELIHLGHNDMYVQLDFEQEGVLWRVLRRRSGGRRGSSTLDLFIIQEDGQRTLQSEGAMRITQEKINRILRLDYDTFIASAFLQQGKADEFTRRQPAERKRILSEILGLEQWNQYEDRVKEKLKEIDAQIHFYELTIAEIDAELARRPGLEAQLEEAETVHVEAQTAREAAEARLKEVEHAPAELRTVRDNRSDRERRLRDYARDLEEVAVQIERQKGQIEDYEKVIAAREEIEEGYAALQSAREADQSFSDMLRQLRTLDESRANLRSQIDSARVRLESEAESLRRNIESLEAASEIDYAADLEEVQTEVTALRTREADRDMLHEKMNEMREESARLGVLRETLELEGKALTDRLARLQNTDEAVCPLCGQELTEDHRAQLVAQIDEEVTSKRAEYRANQERIVEISSAIAEHKTQIGEMDGELKKLSPLAERVGVLQAQVDAAQQAGARLAEETARLREVETRLEQETYAEDVREELAKLDAEQADLGYDQSTHDENRQRIETYRQYEQMETRLRIAAESLPAVQQALEGSLARQNRLVETMATTEGEIAEFDVEIERLGVLVEEYNARDEEVRVQRTRERNAYERLVGARQSLDALESQAARKSDLEARCEQSRYEAALYEQLKQAFGRNGVPAMIIETAIPELETEANDLLSRMTDGRMHLRLNTQREKVTGGVQETLEVEIADELGTRNYELYSGGEAFRINFALRVALSKMLARRAGAHLRTLFIDEGFGTQDDAGRNKLVEAITAIQEDFDLILVITHIDDLRDNFPVHIVVDKTSTGSAVSIR